uniref:Uncharacterized protein n=1 Tax=Musca domestica TaxID=7370 RepID=A0A1I8NKB5_MUSDO
MAALGDFATIRHNLAGAKRTVVVALHKFVYGNEGDRGNRGRLRQFDGFEYDETTDEYKAKAEYVRHNLSAGDLVSICNMLGIAYDVNDLFPYIFTNLKKGCLLNSSNIDDDCQTDEDDPDEDAVSETSETKDRTIVPKQSNDEGDDYNEVYNDDNEDASSNNEVYVGASRYATTFDAMKKTRTTVEKGVNSFKQTYEHKNINRNDNKFRMTQ